MRILTFLLTLFVAGGTASAQSWKEYAYPESYFTVAFPADPSIESTKYQAADGRDVEAHVYSVNQDGSSFVMTVADLAETGLEESKIVNHAIGNLTRGGEIKVDIPHRISRVYGRQLSIAKPDGSRSLVAVFYYKQRLYQIEGKVVAGGASADAIRFQQSLVFTEGT